MSLQVPPRAVVLRWSARHAPSGKSIESTTQLFTRGRLLLLCVHCRWRSSKSDVHSRQEENEHVWSLSHVDDSTSLSERSERLVYSRHAHGTQISRPRILSVIVENNVALDSGKTMVTSERSKKESLRPSATSLVFIARENRRVDSSSISGWSKLCDCLFLALSMNSRGEFTTKECQFRVENKMISKKEVKDSLRLIVFECLVEG